MVSKVSKHMILKKLFKNVKIRANEELFWVILLPYKLNNYYYGIVDNDLIHNHNFDYGDIVKFLYDDIVDVKEL